jgi:hypothetical protein
MPKIGLVDDYTISSSMMSTCIGLRSFISGIRTYTINNTTSFSDFWWCNILVVRWYLELKNIRDIPGPVMEMLLSYSSFTRNFTETVGYTSMFMLNKDTEDLDEISDTLDAYSYDVIFVNLVNIGYINTELCKKVYHVYKTSIVENIDNMMLTKLKILLDKPREECLNFLVNMLYLQGYHRKKHNHIPVTSVENGFVNVLRNKVNLIKQYEGIFV